MFIERLERKYGKNEPIFTNEILDTFKDYSRIRVFQLIKKAIESETLIKYDTGVYYIPTETSYGESTIIVEQVMEKKYIKSNEEVFGIYGGMNMKLSFLLTYQVPVSIEVITNKETMCVRRKKMHGRQIILRKSRCPINKNNVDAYILLELFNSIDVNRYKNDSLVQNEIMHFAKTNKVSIFDITRLATYFPSKALKKMMESGFINELA